MKNKIAILLLCILTVSVLVNAVAADDWPMFQHDADHTGLSTSNGPLTNSTLWTFPTINDVESSPAVANGYVYVCCGDVLSSGNDMVYCLNAQTGTLVWNFTPAGFCFTPAVANGYVYVGSYYSSSSPYDGYLYCLNATTGAEVWNYSAGAYDNVFVPTIANGCVYVGTAEDGLQCVNATTGLLVWQFATSGAAYDPSVSGGYVYVGCSSGTVYCINALTGTPVWNYTTFGTVNDAPVVYNGNVYFGATGAFVDKFNVTCLNAQTGTFVWNFTIAVGEFGTMAVYNGNVYVPTYGSDLFCLNAQTGKQVWVEGTDGPVEDSPAISANGYVYIGAAYGNFYCFNANNGEQLWGYGLSESVAIDSSPAIVNGIVYFGADTDTVYAIGSTQALQNATLSISASSKTITSPPEYKLTISGTLTPSQSGTVTIYESVNGSSFTVFDTAALTSGSYSYIAFAQEPGTYQFYATWPGNSQYNPSQSSIVSVAVGVAGLTTPTLTLQPSSSSITPGQSLMLSGTITPSTSGTVTIYESINGSASTTLGTATLSSGSYSYKFSPSAVGSYQFYATWPGNSQYNSATSTTTSVTVAQAALETATLSIKPSSSSITAGSSLTLSGTLSPSQSGTVTIYESINGSASTTLGTATLSSGSYSYKFSPSAVGSYQFYATWPGNSQYNSAQSSTTTVSVTAVLPTTPTLTLKSSASSVSAGQTVTLSGTISPSATGTVTLSESVNGSAYQAIATPTLTSGAYSYPYTIPGNGTYEFQASFPGNSLLNTAQSSVVTVSSPKTTTSSNTTLYIIIVVIIIIIIIIAAAYYVMTSRSKAKPAK
jgi:outer membrane protein assembly factor BamB